MKQPLDPEGQRRGWQSCLRPLEYQQTPSTGTERCCQRKALRLPGSTHFKDMPPPPEETGTVRLRGGGPDSIGVLTLTVLHMKLI